MRANLEAGVQIPHYFRCPISLEMMHDPVTLSTGQTYDRSSIESWVSTGNTTCPVTRIPLPDFTLIPNHTLRRLIQDWCVSNRSTRIPIPKQPADPALVRTFLTRASSPSAPYPSKLSALKALRTLARDSDRNRSLIAAACGSRQILLSIAFPDLGSEPSDLNHEALALLSVFALPESDCERLARDPLRVGYLVSLLFNSSIDVRISSASVIEAVVAGIRSADLRPRISGAEGVFDGVVGILSFPLACPWAVTAGIKALFALCLVKQHRHRAVAAGAVAALVDRLAELERCDAERALATADLLCRIPAGCAAFGEHALTVPLLVKVILKVSERATEYATGALLSLCLASEAARREAAGAGVLTQMLLVVQSGCTERAKRKAQMLLKLLRDSWPRDSSDAKPDVALIGNDVVLF
ncbi:U-box domain-containing family protein [Striga asiatica]|uniref:U-box domain-containing protein n=1 Tax=Striga asiatica TaxID=4170 RepID=A0A5A7QIY9_STRAF|nr:U-box domain-containing family protein [Striga asiatica]